MFLVGTFSGQKCTEHFRLHVIWYVEAALGPPLVSTGATGAKTGAEASSRWSVLGSVDYSRLGAARKKKMVGAAARFESNSLEGACFAPRRVYIRHTRRADIEPIQRGVHGRQARGVVGTSGCRIGCLQSNKKNQKGLVRSGRLG